MKTKFDVADLLQVEKFVEFFGIHKVQQISGFQDVNLVNWELHPGYWCLYFQGKDLVFTVEVIFSNVNAQSKNSGTIKIVEFSSRHSHSKVFLSILTSTVKFARACGFPVIKMLGEGKFTEIKNCPSSWLCPMAGFLPLPEQFTAIYELIWECGFDYTVSEFFDSEEGLNVWRIFCFDLDCEFLTDENSVNSIRLLSVLNKLGFVHLLI